jgi:hypothetical protein
MAQALRFGVGTPSDVRSSIWRLWGNGDDLYLASRSIAGDVKISFHKSGICRIAQPSSSPRPPYARWKLGPEILPSCSRIFDILVPPILAMLPRLEILRDTKPVILVPTPGDKFKIIFGIYLSGPWITAQDLLALPRDRQLVIHDCVRLKTKLAWLTSYVDEFRVHIELPVIKHYLSEIRAPIRSTRDDAGGFVHLFQTVGVTVPHVADVQLGREHLFVSETVPKKKWVKITTNPTKPPSPAGS